MALDRGNSLAKEKSPRFLPPHPVVRKQKYEYFFILDFEATCDNIEKPEPQVSKLGF